MFGHSLLGAFDNDPFFAHQQQMQQMNEMMQGTMGAYGMMSPFGINLRQQPAAIANGLAIRGDRSQDLMLRANPMDPYGMGSMFGGMNGMFSNMNSMMANMANMQQQMQNPMTAMSNPNAQVYSQSSVMSYSNTGQGPPRVYQATTSKHQGPGGVVQTKKSVRDSESAMEKMSVGRYIGDRGHVQEKVRHTRTGDTEENVEYVNQDEEDLTTFNSDWRDRTQQHEQRAYAHDRRARLDHTQQRALTDGSHRSDDRHRDRSNPRQEDHVPAQSYRERD